MTWMNENLHRHIAIHFGENTLKLVREYERTARKLADYRNHLRFNLRCRHQGLTPCSLRLGSTVKGHRASNILQKAQKHLLNERVRQINFTIEALKQKIEQLKQSLTKQLPDVTLERVVQFIEHAQMAQHIKSKERQISKFTSLLSRSSRLRTEELTWRQKDETSKNTKDTWVKNLSDRVLTQPEKDVLAKGLNYAVTPQHIPVVELITATESAINNNHIKVEEAEQLRLKVSAALSSARAPPSNLTTQERRALTSLSKDPNITILPADKGRCTVVLNTTDYHCKMTSLLSDSNTYEPLRRDPSSSYKKKVIDCLQQLEKEEAIDRALYHRLYPREATPCLYGLPKIHKDGAPLRTIVSSINSVTYSIAKYLANILAPLVGKTVHHIQNAKEFVTNIQGVKLEAEETMVSYDVTSLFTCIPTTEATETVRNRLQKENTLSSRTKLSPNQVCLLLDLCLNTTNFKYKDQFYRQKHGCAMGSPVSPIVANLYMEEVERKALLTFNGTTPSHWFRYVDDTWVKIRSNEVAAFSEHINSVDNNIKFTREDVHENKLAFLDCLISIQEGGILKTEVYRKPTHTDQYLLFDSHHPLEHKLGVIRTLHHRAESVTTDTESKDKECKHLRGALKACGYPDWAFVKTRATKPNRNTKRNNRPEAERRRNIVIPYVAGVSEKLRRIFNKHHIPVFFKPSNTLRQKLVHPKDPTPKEKQSNVVYAVQCSEECTDLYIGETKQLLSKRMAQHRRANTTGQDSAVFLHLKDKGHSFENSNVQILDKESRWFERGVKEAIHVKVEKPSLNRGGGLRHHLSATYNAVLTSVPRQFQ
ncbi:uncharacterized protein LOC105946468, partial [Xenopus tropicalis]|uniref:Uncharacterized protein LOC105946468 n=1 Tax=Xenopus tropicalis TaxID=8364 RepID=A0A8J0SD91_XENTR